MSQQIKVQSKLKMTQCYNCLAQYPVPEQAGCTICPRCGQKSCSE